MIKKTLVLLTLFAGFTMIAASSAEARVFYRRVAPVRRVAARAVLPPYPIARRAVVRPVYRPVVYGPAYYAPAYYAPAYYSPGVSVVVGY